MVSTLTPSEVEAAGSAAARIGRGAAATATQQSSETLLAPKRSMLGSFGNIFSLAATMIMPLQIVTMVSRWQWVGKLPVIGGLLRTGGRFTGLNDTSFGALGFGAAKASLYASKSAAEKGWTGAADAMKSVAGGALGAHKSIASYAQKTVGQSAFGAKALQKVSEASITNVAFAGSMVVGGGANIAMTFGMRLRALKRMQAELTGKPAPSTYAVLMGKNLDPLVLEARKEFTGKQAILGTILQIAGMLGNTWMMFDRSSGIKSFIKMGALAIVPGMVENMLTSQNTALAAYNGMCQSFAHTGKAALGDYVGVIGGLAKHADPQMVEKFARQCFEKQLPPAGVLKFMSETSFFKKPEKQAPAQKKANAPVTIGTKTFTTQSSEGGFAAKFDPAGRAAGGAVLATR